MTSAISRPPKAARTGYPVANYTIPPPSEAVAVAIPFFNCWYSIDVPPQCSTELCAKDGDVPMVVDEVVVSCLCNPNRSRNALASKTECQGYRGSAVDLSQSSPGITVWRIAMTNLTTCAFTSRSCANNVCNTQLSHPIQGDNGIFEQLGATGDIPNPNPSWLYHCTADYDTAFSIYSGEYNFTACNANESMRCLPPGSFTPNATSGIAAATTAQATQAAASSDAVAPLVSLLAVLLVLFSVLGLGVGV